VVARPNQFNCDDDDDEEKKKNTNPPIVVTNFNKNFKFQISNFKFQFSIFNSVESKRQVKVNRC